MADEKGSGGKRRPKKQPNDDTPDKDAPVAGGPRDPGDVNPPDLHRQFVEQRTGGGAAPNREAYDAALAQWRKLPGAVIGVARDIALDTDLPEEKEDDSNDDADREERPDDSDGDSSQEQ